MNPYNLYPLKYLPLILTFCFFSCSGNKEKNENILLSYAGETLTYQDVVACIPNGLIPEDSAALFKSVVDGWLQDVVLAEFAEERLIDTNSIDRRVRNYRNNLIVKEYLSRMRESRPPRIDEVKIREYYDNHRHELKLEVPLVKGVFLKVNSGARGREEIKSLISSDDPEKIDRLEQIWLDRAIEYNYFRDKWIDWETLTGLIPHRFGEAGTFLERNNYFETDYGDCAYYLKITDYLAAGEEQPFEYAKIWITELLTQGEILEYERQLINSLVEKSLKENKLEAVGYDPLKHEMIKQEDEKR